MLDLGSSPRFRGAALLSSLAVVWLASSIFSVPYGFRWMGLGCVVSAVSAALWIRIRSRRSIAPVLPEVEAEPMPAVAAKPARVAASTAAHLAWMSRLTASEAAKIRPDLR